ncbi:hypothetical protein [Phenylobacterium sp.]|uniref:hypothetical protein n=1 Tax=Phenylobacterium sp. TaxID=1871053 RepID=UPI0026158832|nr:hypothetical protein [Phenylobacterium sp.]
MTLLLFAPAALPSARPASRPGLPALLRQLRALWWLGVREYVAALHGLPREAVEAPPHLRWPFGHL